MGGWRSHDGQFSDRQPIRRSREEKLRLLQRLREEQASFKPWVAASVKEALARRIADLEAELSGSR